jgi:hypothetical protein
LELFEQKNPSNIRLGFSTFLWCGPGLNRRHMDFQSIALPTELPHLLYLSGGKYKYDWWKTKEKVTVILLSFI